MNEKVLVVGAHGTSGSSMKRYSSILGRAWSEAGATVEIAVPPEPLTSHLSDPRIRKWIGYIEKFLVYPLILRRRSRGCDWVHIADHSDALWALFLPSSARIIVTCHDLIAVRAALGELAEHRPGLSGRLYQSLVLRGLKRADRVVSVSSATARDLERLTGHSQHVLLNPIDGFLSEGRAANSPGLIPTHPYLLVVSTVSWRKRREAALTAWAELRRTRSMVDIGLLVVGPKFTEAERRILADSPSGRVCNLNNVSDVDLYEIYSNCSALLFLSRYEGFGWPIIEAQAAGRPVLATDSAVYREVGGRGCVYAQVDNFSQLELEEWEGMAQKLLDPGLAAEGRANVQRFDWPNFVTALRLLGESLPMASMVPTKKHELQ